ncbi:bromodomain-containing protein 9 isoform X1 [Ornithorhynchus anatinus]|uniref:bromodomain-containing protein 9 isoform X1 n=1 Tax=Ornithorhynchus anatinus TaxID=9258 RepID=UPI0010A92ACA|nr:bromodomain-containing protein 9 isoform X1 [Ornithorhynchus anatinus]
MGKKHKKHKAEWRSSYNGSDTSAASSGPTDPHMNLGGPLRVRKLHFKLPCDNSILFERDYVDKPLDKPLKLVLKVGGSEVTELSGSGHDSSYYDDRSDHERERHKEKKKKKKKKSEKEKEKHLDDEERRKRKEEKKRKREKEHCDTEGETDDFDPRKKVEVEPPPDRPIRACRTQPAENESTPIQQLLEHFLRQLQRKDPHGFFAFPVTDAIAPGYSMIIKHPMDFGTMKDKIVANEYKSVTEFKADFKLMCDNAMTYNRPDTVYYKLAKKILHTGFKMMSKERLLALKRSMSFMQDMDFSQQAALLGNEDPAVEEPVPEVIPVQVETAKKSKKPSKEVISCIFEPEGNACSLTDSTAEEHVLALVEHAADEARDRIHRYLPNSKVAAGGRAGTTTIAAMGYLKKNGDGALLYSVVNSSDPEAEEEETHSVDLSSLSSKLLPGFTTLGFKDERRNKVTFLTSASTGLSVQNNSVFSDLKSDEMELLYAAYGDETGIQCALSLQEFVKDSGSYSKKIVDDLLDQITGGDHSKTIYQLKQRRNIPMKPPDEVKIGDSMGDSSSSVLDFMSMKSYSDVSLDISMLSSLGKVKKELDHDENHLNLDETTKLLQDLHEAQTDRVGSRPSSNLSSLSNASERDQHHLGSPSHLSAAEQQDMVHDPYEFLQSPEPAASTNS